MVFQRLRMKSENKQESECVLTPIVSGTAFVEVDCTKGTVKVKVVVMGNVVVGKELETPNEWLLIYPCGRACTLCMQLASESTPTIHFIFVVEFKVQEFRWKPSKETRLLEGCND
jgi:hypothetical protein